MTSKKELKRRLERKEMLLQGAREQGERIRGWWLAAEQELATQAGFGNGNGMKDWMMRWEAVMSGKEWMTKLGDLLGMMDANDPGEFPQILQNALDLCLVEDELAMGLLFGVPVAAIQHWMRGCGIPMDHTRRSVIRKLRGLALERGKGAMYS